MSRTQAGREAGDPSAVEVTAVSLFHPGGNGDFDVWASALATSARTASGVTSVVTCTEWSDLGVAVTFCDEDHLDSWLDGADRATIVDDAASAGWLAAAPPILLGSGLSVPPGVGAFRHRIESGREADFAAAQRELTVAAQKFAGYQGTAVFVDADGSSALSVLRFRSDRTLTNWVSSPERAVALSRLRAALVGDFVVISDPTPFGTVVRRDRGKTVMTPNWKSAMLVLMVLYPTVMLLSRFLGPVLDHAGATPGVALWLSQVVSVGLMQWWLMPWASKPFRTWLDPVDGGGWRSNLAGALTIGVVYAATLTLFESVRWLQFWDFRG